MSHGRVPEVRSRPTPSEAHFGRGYGILERYRWTTPTSPSWVWGHVRHRAGRGRRAARAGSPGGPAQDQALQPLPRAGVREAIAGVPKARGHRTQRLAGHRRRAAQTLKRACTA